MRPNGRAISHPFTIDTAVGLLPSDSPEAQRACDALVVSIRLSSICDGAYNSE